MYGHSYSEFEPCKEKTTSMFWPDKIFIKHNLETQKIKSYLFEAVKEVSPTNQGNSKLSTQFF